MITGEHFDIEFPDVDTDCMNAFLGDLSKKYEGKKIALIIDGAGWHKSKRLKKPDNIDIFLLPPYSPELNPVERFWKFLKQNILSNRLFESLDKIKLDAKNFLDSLQNPTILQLCKNNYLDI